MKIRKALAVVLSLAMTVTLMPATAFASSNSIGSVPTVKDDAVAEALVKATLDEPLVAGDTQKLSLEITQNGTFAYGDANDDATLRGYDDAEVNKSIVVRTIAAGDTAVQTSTTSADGKLLVALTDSSDKSVDVELTYVNAAAPTSTLKKDTIIYFYLYITADGSDGDEIQVSMDGDDVISDMSAKTVATIKDDGTTTTVEDPSTVGRGTGIDAAEVTIKENTGDAVDGAQKITLTLPKGVTWNDAMVENFAANQTAAEFKTNVEQYSGTLIDKTKAFKATISEDNKRELVIEFTAANTSSKDKLVITPVINVTKDANKGDIKLKIEKNTGEISAENDLVIAKYGDVNVSVLCKDADKLPEVVAGKLLNTEDKNFVVSITFEENSKDALTSEKYIDLKFNSDAIQVKDAPIKYFIGDKYDKKKYGDLNTDAENDHIVTDIDSTDLNDDDNIKGDRSEFTITVPNDAVGGDHYLAAWDKDDANILTLFIPVTVSADYVGDITLTAKGNAGIDETTVTVAKAIAPVTVETTVTKVVNGAQAQATANVKITENFAGALAEADDDEDTLDGLILKLDNLGLGGVVFKGDGKATVTAGDIEIKDSKKGSGARTNEIIIGIDNESTVASTIEVSDLAINLGRLLPEGEYDLKVTGDAVVVNGFYNKGDFSANAVKTPYINITTAADTAQTGTVANFFLDGSKNSTYTVNGTDATMDAAAYLDSNNRTMVPIRYVAYALGLADTDISYNVGDSTATLSGLTNVVKVTTGSNVLQASNGNVVMDTVAVNNSGRLYVPARFIAQAMGAQVAWDQATKTVTITK